MKKTINKTNNYIEVYVSDETMSHMKAHSDVSFEHIKEAISKIDLDKKSTFLMTNVDLKKNIGKDNCVLINSEDDVRLEQRPNRKGLTPVVYNREAEDTSLINIGVCVDDDGLWTLFTAFYGVLAPKEPWDERLTENEREESEAFWSTHALVK